MGAHMTNTGNPAAPVRGPLAGGLRLLGLHPELWAGLAPNGIGQQKPHHYRDMLRIAREQLPHGRHALEILTKGVCDGCALGLPVSTTGPWTACTSAPPGWNSWNSTRWDRLTTRCSPTWSRCGDSTVRPCASWGGWHTRRGVAVVNRASRASPGRKPLACSPTRSSGVVATSAQTDDSPLRAAGVRSRWWMYPAHRYPRAMFFCHRTPSIESQLQPYPTTRRWYGSRFADG